MNPPSVFIVEDEAIVADDIRETLKSLGYAVAGMARTGESALEKIAETRPDIVLMDIHIVGNMDGIETAGKIRTLYNIPVVFLTAHADAGVLERAKKTEPYGYIIKPYDDRGLQSTIEMALYKFKADERIRDNEALIRSLINITDEPEFIIDKETNVLFINDALLREKGITDPISARLTLKNLVTSGIVSPALADAVQEHFYDKVPFKFEEEFRGKWLAYTICPLVDPNNRINRCAIDSFDITQIKLHEQDLVRLAHQLEDEKQALSFLTAMLDSMDDYVVATDLLGNIMYFNKVFRERFGYTLDELRGKHISTIKYPGDPFAMDTTAFFVDNKNVWTGEVTLVNKYGIRTRTSLKSTPVSPNQQNACRVFVLREKLG